MQHRIDLDHCRLQVVVEGAGQPLLLVHGFPLAHRMWSEQIERLQRHYRVIAPDLRGFGASSLGEKTLVDQGISMKQFAADLAAVLDKLEIAQPVHFCGLSMGGYIAWQFWKHDPRRVKSLILCDTRATADTEEVAQGREMMAVRVLQEGTDFVAEGMLPKLLAEKNRINRPELVESVRSMIQETSPQTIAAAQRGMAQRPDCTAMLSSIQVPVLILVGSEDAITPVDEMRAIAETIPTSRFVEVPDAGHLAPMENPGVVNEALEEFLEAV